MDLSLRRDTKRLLLLMVLLGIYLLSGAAVFQVLENETEQREVAKLNKVRKITMRRYNMSVEEFNALIKKVEVALSHRCQRTEESWCQNRWSYYASLYFTASVVTTIGYGHLAPSTFGGRMFCLVFALLGIPLNLMVLKHIGDKIHEFIHWCHYKIETKICKRDVNVLKTKTLLWSAAVMVVLLLLGGVLYSQTERWSFLDSVYYCFVTFSTIGFGDLVPNQGKEPVGAYGIFMEVLQAFVVVLGLSILFSIISSVLTVSEEMRVTFPPSKNSASQQTPDEDVRSGEESYRKVPDSRRAGWLDVNAFAASKMSEIEKPDKRRQDGNVITLKNETSNEVQVPKTYKNQDLDESQELEEEIPLRVVGEGSSTDKKAAGNSNSDLNNDSYYTR